MSHRGSERNYRFGQKDHWRRTLWNDVLRRTAGREKTEPILYLAGPQDLDRWVAESKGVPSQNLIAIDTKRSNVLNVKRLSLPAIDADVQEILVAWPQSRPVCGVVLDFCSGLEEKLMWRTLSALLRSPFSGAVIAINFMRGRDASTNEYREIVSRHDLALYDLLSAAKARFISPLSISNKNRAALYSFMVAHDFGMAVSRHLPQQDLERRAFEITATILTMISPTLISYRSGGLVFDTVIYKTPSLWHTEFCGVQFSEAELDARLQTRNTTALARRISALLAVRTGRMSA